MCTNSPRRGGTHTICLMSKWHNFSNSDEPFDPQMLGAPWSDRPSIFGHIERSINVDGTLGSDHVALPDESPPAENQIRFSAGSIDGMTGHGMGDTSATDVARTVLSQLSRVIKSCDGPAFNVLHGYLLEHPTLSYVDQLNLLLTEVIPDFGVQLAALGRYLLKNAADREVVKFAINLVGVCGGQEDHAALQIIGAHEEFTLYAVVAMAHAGGDVQASWEMAKRVRGWGRIQCIERLDQEIFDPEIKEWLLTEGYANSIMIEYTAAICAKRGGLLEALCDPNPDEKLIESAAEILGALARGGPCASMTGYDESAPATERFLEILEHHPSPRVSWLLASQDILDFADYEPDGDPPYGWTPEVRLQCAFVAKRIRLRPVWQEIVDRGLLSVEEYPFNCAARAAELIGMDVWDHRFKRLLAGYDQWYWLLETKDPARLDRLLDHADRSIDFSQITTGYGDALGFGPKYEEHSKLGWVLQALRRWPNRGRQFIDAGLRSPVTRNRACAAYALLTWPVANRHSLMETVRELHRIETHDRLKADLARLLAGEVVNAETEFL